MQIKLSSNTDFSKTKRYIDKVQTIIYRLRLDSYGRQGVQALREMTPIDTGKTRDSWRYEIKKTKNRATISWINDNENEGVNIAIILQYGHATGWGSYVEGHDYINPAIRPVFKNMSDQILEEVKVVR